MTGSYRQCTECGKRALSIATRCPGCGREFPAPRAWEVGRAPRLRRFPAPRVVGWTVAIGVVLIGAGLARPHRPLGRRSSHVVADSASASSQVAYTAAAAARLDPATAAPLPAASVGEVFVARTWTNVRKWRNKLADVEAVLLPGDTILADSLEGGWYRVRLEGKVLGYVYRSTLGRP